MKRTGDIRRARTRPHGCLFKAAARRIQDAFDRIDAKPCGPADLVRDPCSVTRPSSAPLSSAASLPSLSGKSRRAALPCASLDRLAAHLDCAGKMLLTDLCNRHSDTSTRISPDSRARGFRRDVRLRQ
jgi:hypothetical protein